MSSVPLTTHCPQEPAAADADQLLQASRRVDWRFLLPEPELGATAYLGAVDTELVESLRLFCTSLTVGSSAALRAGSTHSYSGVVAKNPQPSELALAARLAGPGAFVYVEVCRQTAGSHWFGANARRGRQISVPSMLAAMRQLGLVDLEAHWHWPNFAACCEIVPLSSRAAGICSLRRRGSGARQQWKSRFAQLLWKSNLFSSCVNCFSILGRDSS